MSNKEDLKKAMKGAEINDVELDTVAGGAAATCGESCYSSCSMCCKDGSANRGGDTVLPESPFQPS